VKNLIDTSTFCGHWPFRNLPFRSPGELKEHLSSRGVKKAWVTSAEAILLPDPMQGNLPLLAAIANDPFFVPVAVLDVTLAGWRKDFGAFIENKKFRAIKLTPNYHSYSLNDPRADGLAECAGAAGVPVCIQVRMMDERSHHALMKVPGVPTPEIAALAKRHPKTRFLACAVDPGSLKLFAGLTNLWSEISFVESRNTLPQAIEKVGAKQLVFGSHSPLFYFETSSVKLEAAVEEVSEDELRAIGEKNADALVRK
jgi:hypothetical protein